MPHPQFASFRATPPAPTYTVNSGGATTSSRNLYFRWQYQNRYGLNLGVISGPLAIALGQRLDITIPATARLAGEDIHYFVLSASTTNDPASFRQLAYYKGYEVDQVTPSPLPYTLTLSQEEHFAIASTVANEAALPTGANLISGMIRFVTSLSSYFYYDSESSATVGVNVLAAATGRWLRIGGWDTYIEDTTDSDGCDRDVRKLASSVARVPSYDLSGPGVAVRYLLFNSRSEDGGIVPQSTPISFTFTVNGIDRSQFFSNYWKIVFEGYYRASTGVLDTSLDGVGIVREYQYGVAKFTLPSDLPNGYAYAFRAYPEVSAYVLNDLVPEGADIGLKFAFLGQSGNFNPAGALTGDFINPEAELRRIVPSTGLTAIALSGSGSIAKSDFPVKPQTIVAGFTANTANQKVAIDGNGTVAVVSAIATGQAQRALVGTVDGVGEATSFTASSVTLDSTTQLKVTVTYPTSVRSDYPDAIANSTAGEFNATKVRVYVQPSGGGAITQFDAAIAPGTTQKFLVGAVAGTATGSSLPTVANNFGLYAPEDADYAIAAQAGSSVFSAGSHVVAIAYYYEGTITSISHAQSDGNVPEAIFTLAELQEAAKAVGPAVSDIAALRAIASANRPAFQSRFAVTQGNPYRFYPDELTADNGSNIVKPNDLAVSDPGRWVLDDASQILHGMGNPSNTLGENGDYYYDVDDNTLPTFGNLHYKSSGVWTLLANVVGPQGEKGNSFLLLDRNPLVTEGIDGDTAFNYISRDLFERSLGAWIYRQNLRDIDFKGNWSELTQYEKDDAVLYNRDLWRSLRTSTGVTPVEGADWTMLLPGGQDGIAATITIDTVTTVGSGGAATVTNTGTSSSAILNFEIPQGATGPAGSVTSSTGALTFDNNATPPTVTATQTAIYSDALGILKWIGNGVTGIFAFLDVAQVWSAIQTFAATRFKYTAAPTTAAGELGLFATAAGFKLREESDGAERSLAVLEKPQDFTKSQAVTPVSVPYSSTVTLDCNLSNTFLIGTLIGNITVNISNLRAGQSVAIRFTQDATGGKTVTWQSEKFQWAGGSAGILSTTGNAVDDFFGLSFDGIKITGNLLKGVA